MTLVIGLLNPLWETMFETAFIFYIKDEMPLRM